jgi:hypothetical protein
MKVKIDPAGSGNGGNGQTGGYCDPAKKKWKMLIEAIKNQKK